MVGLLQTLAVEEGYTLTPLPGAAAAIRPALARTPVLYDPGIVIVARA
jgi:16S rRNA C1402 (ribose-2'-O) methylase RsmI